MSYLSRTLKYQYRILHALETTAFTILTGLGLKKIVVFPEFKDTADQALCYSKVLQKEIDSYKYKNIMNLKEIT